MNDIKFVDFCFMQTSIKQEPESESTESGMVFGKRIKLEVTSTTGTSETGSNSRGKQTNGAMSSLFGDVLVRDAATSPAEKADNEMHR